MEKAHFMKAQMFIVTTAFSRCRCVQKSVERKPLKAQMFIVTVVFLVGLIFTVQQILFQYSFLDAPSNFEKNDYYIFSDVKDIINQTIKTAKTCDEAEQNMEEVITFLDEQSIDNYILEIAYQFNCTNWNTDNYVLNLTITLRAADSETTGNYVFYNK